MTTPCAERLEAILRQMEHQDGAWQEAWEVLAKLGDDAVAVAVPRDVLTQIAGPTTEQAPPVKGMRA
jgi:hypothetical protein